MKARVLLLGALVLALLPAPPLRAQGKTRSPHGALSADCHSCHTSRGWIPVAPRPSFQHEKTGFALVGAHAQASCRSCHRDLVFNHVGTSCSDCHKDPHRGELGSRCDTCHNPRSWTIQPEIMKVHNRTRLPLFAVHATVACDACHKGQQPTEFVNTPVSCAVCHRQAAQQARSPNHVLAGFTQQRCEECHLSVARAWRQTTFRHPASFVLKAAHATAKCEACHAATFKGTPRVCAACHLADFDRAKNPDHRASAFPTQCEACHRETAWRPATFTDHAKTRFPLAGAHQRVDCARCHVGGRYTGTPATCAACHQADYQAAQNPAHAAAGIPETCESCHTANAWRPASFDHNKSRFPLTGAHRPLQCARCHTGGQFGNASPACSSCHAAAFQGARNPNHVASNFPTTCASCHSTSAWRPASFTDHGKTRFPLTGAHQAVSCAQCHVGGRTSGTPLECVACHGASFQAAKNPNHVAGGFSTQCKTCHTTAAWQPASFADHGKTRFPLTGAHQRVDCARCHAGGKYTGTPLDCNSCHQANYRATTNPNHVAGNFPTTCATCHTTSAWRPATGFDHAKTRFPLAGAHQRVDCARCHVGGKYTGTPLDCNSCHQANYRATTNPNHVAGNFPTTCNGCHTLNGWRPASFTDHGKTRFPLTGAHQRVDCARCHVGGKYTGTPLDCNSCHQANYRATTNPNHAAGNFPTTCATCHTTSAWRPATFNHSTTRFPLAGAHQRVDCARCHVGGRYTGTPMDCYSCHQANYRATANPNHVAGNFPTTCGSCHTLNGWRPASFSDHGKTRFPLTGAHQRVDCAQCHVGGRYTGTPLDCYSCHQANYRATANPNHAAGNFPTTCATCHTTSAWRPATFNHSTTRFPLAGAHQRVDCARCHVGGRYTGTPMDCYSCHQPNYRATTNPNHVAGNFSTQCDGCHTVNAWRPASFKDHGKTRFPLTGAHQRVDCAQCHVGGRYTGTPTDCYACHQASFRSTQNPNHVAASFPTTCTSCHTTSAWRPATFDHGKTRFPLAGAHRSVDCARCHVGGRYTGTPLDCYSCHQANYRATTNPNHVARASRPVHGCHTRQRLAASDVRPRQDALPAHRGTPAGGLRGCHVGGRYAGTPDRVRVLPPGELPGPTNPNHVGGGLPDDLHELPHDERLDAGELQPQHDAVPADGAHTALSCTQCHVGGVYAGTSTDCYACHQANYQNAKNPNHVTAGFPTTCTNCHTTTAGTPANFNHSTTKFPLTGRHTALSCTQCHVGGKYTGTSTDCYACHQANYQNTKNPNHVTAGMPTTCTNCHTTSGWTPANFNHSTTKFPLTGRHTALSCTQCHVGGKYTGTSTDCYACHQANYQNTKNPNHVTAGMPTTCTNCHTTSGWTPANFNHSTTKFPLTGRHTALSCTQCHVGGKYTGTSTDCYACHQAKYQATANPNHVAAGFPTTCATCHTTNGWTPANFNHTWFPSNHGNARACADCHKTANNYRAFECILCHEHSNKTDVDGKHKGVGGYAYTSAACYQCHPRGRH